PSLQYSIFNIQYLIFMVFFISLSFIIVLSHYHIITLALSFFPFSFLISLFFIFHFPAVPSTPPAAPLRSKAGLQVQYSKK
ncbi:MAG TPA: hypothetical protein VF008_13335, partial [Niastella sp.]